MSDDFGKLLSEWEKQKKQTVRREKKAQETKNPSWALSLDKFAPESSDLAHKSAFDSTSKEPQRSTKVQRRQFPIQDEIDLHGKTGPEALGALDSFFREARKQKLKKIRIIHGRGIHSGGDAVLKPLVQTWATNLKGVKWEACSPEDGGAGAIWLWLGDLRDS